MRYFLAFLLVVGAVLADPVDEKIKMLVDKKGYLMHQRLLDVVFKDRAAFYLDNERLDVVKIAQTLKENGLLDIFYKEPREVEVTFETSGAPLFFLKAMTDTLRELGYNFYLPKKVQRGESGFSWTIGYQGDRAIDPVILAKRLEGYGISITDLARNNETWHYVLENFAPSLADATSLRPDRRVLGGPAAGSQTASDCEAEYRNLVSPGGVSGPGAESAESICT